MEEVPCRDTDPIEKGGGSGMDDGGTNSGPGTPNSRAKVMPTAFTIDFGDDGGSEKSLKRNELRNSKKFTLKEGIRHFAPAKKTLRDKPQQQQQQQQTGAGTHLEDLKGKTEVKVVQQHLEERISESNNNIIDKKSLRAALDAADAGSDTGTYTIDNEDLEVENERKKIDQVFDVSEKQANSDYVAQWASSSHPVGGGSPGFPSSDSPNESGRETSASRSRRKLPATPEAVFQRAPSTTENYLQDTLSVMAAMEARIGGIGGGGGGGSGESPDPLQVMSKSSSPASVTKKNASSASKMSQSVTSLKEERKLQWERRKNYDPLRSSGLNRNKQTNASASAANSAAAAGINMSSFEESGCSDSCSEVEHNSLHIRETSILSNSSSRSGAHKSHGSPRALSATKPNRAFALRKKLNSASSMENNLQMVPQLQQQPQSSLNPARRVQPSAGHSSMPTGGLRNSGGKQQQPVRTGMPPGKPQNPMLKKTVSEGRSSSSLSSKEAEFQAWKRRKNYNPMRSALQSKKSPVVAKLIAQDPTPKSGGGGPKNLQQQQQQLHSDSDQSSRGALRDLRRDHHHHPHQQHQHQRGGGLEPRRISVIQHNGLDGSGNMQRSASFHYPDGFSRIHHNVYTSEDDSADEYSSLHHQRSPWNHHELLEVNDDEFILPIGAKARPVHPPSSKGQKGSSSGSGKMEALDNLVISTIFSISTKLCINSASIIRRAQERTANVEQQSIMDTLVRSSHDNNSNFRHLIRSHGPKKSLSRLSVPKV